jgi:small subunit ribosomal protein S6
MRRYETIAIIDPDIPEDDRTSLMTRIKEIIPQQDGVLVQEDLWGARKLAYPIKKKPRGFYARYDYCAMGNAVEELERFFRIDDRVLKYLTVLLDPEADVEKIQAEIAEAQTDEASEDQAEKPKTDAEPEVKPENKAAEKPSAETDTTQAAVDETPEPAASDEAAAEASEKE